MAKGSNVFSILCSSYDGEAGKGHDAQAAVRLRHDVADCMPVQVEARRGRGVRGTKANANKADNRSKATIQGNVGARRAGQSGVWTGLDGLAGRRETGTASAGTAVRMQRTEARRGTTGHVPDGGRLGHGRHGSSEPLQQIRRKEIGRYGASELVRRARGGQGGCSRH